MKEALFGKPSSYYEAHSCIHTAREINQQPESWRTLAKDLAARKEEITAFMEQALGERNLRIVTTGAGSSAFVGESMQYLLANEMGIHTENVHSTDIISMPDSTLFEAPTLLISYARSGESPESMAAIRFARKRIQTLYNVIIVCDKNSSLAKLGYSMERTLVLCMPPETCDKGFAMTSSVSSMALATWCLFHYKELEIYAEYVNCLAGSTAKELEELADKAEEIAGFDYRRIIWLGTGALKGLAREACVKSMELTDGYVHAGYDAPTGFRHGPKTVVNDGTLTVHFMSNQPYSLKYDVDFVNEMIGEKSGNRIAVVRPRGQKEDTAGEDYLVTYELPEELPVGSEMGAYMKCLVFSQLLSMKKSLALWYKTDSPCEKGGVNRVVKGIVIYEI